MDDGNQITLDNLSDKAPIKAFSRRAFLKGTVYLSALATLDSTAGRGEAKGILGQAPVAAPSWAEEQWIPHRL